MDLKQIILNQKVASRKLIARMKLSIGYYDNYDDIIKEEKIIKYDFSKIKTAEEFNDVINSIKNENPDEKINYLPRFGNLISILEENALEEKREVERKRMPSQNDLTRWALKDSVLAYYQGLDIPDNYVIVKTKYDDRLVTELAPDFENIYKIWIEKLDELKNRDDKYTLTMDEYDKAESDLVDGMRGSAFEKQLDRYREDFMKKLLR